VPWSEWAPLRMRTAINAYRSRPAPISRSRPGDRKQCYLAQPPVPDARAGRERRVRLSPRCARRSVGASTTSSKKEWRGFKGGGSCSHTNCSTRCAGGRGDFEPFGRDKPRASSLGRARARLCHLSGRVTLTSGGFAMLDDEHGFRLAPWRPALGRQLRKPVRGLMMPDGRVDWNFGRSAETAAPHLAMLHEKDGWCRHCRGNHGEAVKSDYYWVERSWIPRWGRVRPRTPGSLRASSIMARLDHA
jgi:hypothetical protein